MPIIDSGKKRWEREKGVKYDRKLPNVFHFLGTTRCGSGYVFFAFLNLGFQRDLILLVHRWQLWVSADRKIITKKKTAVSQQHQINQTWENLHCSIHHNLFAFLLWLFTDCTMFT